jgi:sugar/nucleoside kinase (ribokinase family)
MAKVLMVGDIMVDVVVALEDDIQRGSDTPSKITQTIGGTGINVATWAKHTGGEPFIIGCIGNDIGGSYIESHLNNWGIEFAIQKLEQATTGMVVALAHLDGERSMFPDSRANSELSEFQFDSIDWKQFSHFYISGYTLFNLRTRELAKKLMATARANGVAVVLDPASAAPLSSLHPEELASWLINTDYLVPNEMELRTIIEKLETDLSGLISHTPNLIIKLGSAGAIWFAAGVNQEFQAPIVEVVDSVGAGDAFAGALLAELSAGKSVPVAIEQAIKAGASSVGMRGAQPIKA